MKSALVAVALSVATVVGGAQTFRSGVDAIRVDVLVLDGKRPVTGLTAADFELLDSGVPQTIEAASMDDVPISLLVALDTSVSVQGDILSRLKEAAMSAVGMLRESDRAALLLFSNTVVLSASWGTDRNETAAAIARAQAGGSTSLYDAAFTSLLVRDDAPGQRNLAIIFSDGDDTASWLPDTAAVDKAHRTETVVYGVEISDTRASERAALRLKNRSGIALKPPAVRSLTSGTPFLMELAESSGGERFAVRRASELRDVFARIVTDFRSRYVLTYTATGVEAKGWHPIEVKLKGRKGTVRARRGYSR
jgi:Ca-activated chloride channel family protein